MYEQIQHTLKSITIEELKQLNLTNDLKIDIFELEQFHNLLLTHFDEILDESSLSIQPDRLVNKMSVSNISKFHELITSIKRSIILKKLS